MQDPTFGSAFFANVGMEVIYHSEVCMTLPNHEIRST